MVVADGLTRRQGLPQTPRRRDARPVHSRIILKVFVAVLAVTPAAVTAQSLQSGSWDVTSKVVDLTVPGLPTIFVHMIRGKSKAEHKRLAAGDGVEALLAPDPKAQCRVESQGIADGRYVQALTCPQKHGEPLHIARAGTYTSTGFVGRASITGATPKGAMSITLDQRAVRTGG